MIHKLARQNAIPLELKKDGLSQRQSGDWILRFVVQASDMDERLMKAAMGTRFQAALVEIGDDEIPVHQPAKELPASEPHSGRASWRDLQPAVQAGIRCEDPVFKTFINEIYPDYWTTNSSETAIAVRLICNVNSRSELSTNHKARVLWHQLDEQFLAWKALEHA